MTTRHDDLPNGHEDFDVSVVRRGSRLRLRLKSHAAELSTVNKLTPTNVGRVTLSINGLLFRALQAVADY